MKNVFLAVGDITRTKLPVDAIITLVNSEGMWAGGVDNAIYAVVGTQFHEVVLRHHVDVAPLTDGMVIVAEGAEAGFGDRRMFKDVVFVIDDLQQSLDELVYSGLCAAHKAGYHLVALPAMRTGVMAGMVERDAREAAQRMKEGIEKFQQEFPDSDMEIMLVIYGNPQVVKYFEPHAKVLPG